MTNTEKTFQEWLKLENERDYNDNHPTVPVFVPHWGSPSVVEPPVPDFKHRGVGVDSDPVSKPVHYNDGKIECIDAIEAATHGLSGFEGYCAGNALKYIWRHRLKNGTQDLEKARWYINRLIDARKARGAK